MMAAAIVYNNMMAVAIVYWVYFLETWLKFSNNLVMKKQWGYIL